MGLRVVASGSAAMAAQAAISNFKKVCYIDAVYLILKEQERDFPHCPRPRITGSLCLRPSSHIAPSHGRANNPPHFTFLPFGSFVSLLNGGSTIMQVCD